jgi:hypothetical protein
VTRWALVGAALAVAACGGHHAPPPRTPRAAATPATTSGKPVTRAEVAVIRGWADALRRGHLAAATRLFAVPVTIANGPTFVLRTRREVREFNRTLPCGARLTRWQRASRGLVVATFTLTNRVGSRCDAPRGTLAAVAFLIRGGKIARWLRVEVPGQAAGQNPV